MRPVNDDVQADGELADGQLVDDGASQHIQFVRTYPYPIDEVWDAITNPARIANWWLPFDAEITLELVPGGKYELRGAGDEPIVLSWTVLRVDPPHVFEHTHQDTDSVVRWTLSDDGDGCRLVLTQTAPDRDAVVRNNFLVGLHTSLDRLALELAGVDDNPWDWEAHDVHAARYADNGLAAPTVR